jgi:hypothetical protein
MKKTLWYCFAVFALLPALPGAAQEAREAFAGSWAATVESNGAAYRYALSLRDGGGCTVRVTGPGGTQGAEGFWSWDGSIFKLEAAFQNPVLPALRSLRWVSAARFSGPGAFNLLIPPDSYREEKVRVTFFRGSAALPEGAAERSFAALSKDLPEGARVAVLQVAAGEEGALLAGELTLALVNARRFTVVDRTDIDAVLREQHFQLSGNVDDDAAVSIGKFLGARIVITGSAAGEGARRHLVLKAIDVETAEIIAMTSEAL